MRILVIGDEPSNRRTLRTALEESGHTVDEVDSAAGAIRQIQYQGCDVALVDLRPGRESSLDLLETLLRGHPRLAVVVLTAHSDVTAAVEAMRRGALDFLQEPFTPEQVRAVLERVIRFRGLTDRVANLEDQVRAEVPEAALDSPDPLVRRVMEQARVVAPTEAVVLIRGEHRTGKGVLARTLHAWSKRPGGPFATVTCPGLSPDLLERDLFGHLRRADSDAVRDASGKVAATEGGTLFLDEVGELPLAIQSRLLRFLQDRKYERVGEEVTRTADVRVVAATHRDLDAADSSGAFRQDLLFRLNVIELVLPPLRLRSDVGALADRLLAFFARQTGRRLTGFSPEALEALAHYPWPGNIRELRSVVERAAILAAGPEVVPDDLPERIAQIRVCTGGPVEVGRRVSLDRLEAEHIRRVLRVTSSLDEAAQVLDIDASTLYRKRKRLGL
jgi:NtrC-family two-component system response regulator AlgB